MAGVLKGQNISGEAIERLRSCLERAEFARFAPGADTQEARKDLLDAAKASIDEIERSLNGKA
jgi:hypothetical protein